MNLYTSNHPQPPLFKSTLPQNSLSYHSITNYPSSNFNLDFCFPEHESPSDHYFNDPQFSNNLRNLFRDVFPYFKIKSAITIIILIQFFVYLFVPHSYQIIRPYYRFTLEIKSITAWFLCPFVVGNIEGLCVHTVFLMIVGSEMQDKMEQYDKIGHLSGESSSWAMRLIRKQNFIWLYVGACIMSTVICTLTLLPASSLISSNLPTYCLYAYLQFLDHKLHLRIAKEFNNVNESEINMDLRPEPDEFGQEYTLVRIYKTIIVSYIVLVGSYSGQMCWFEMYLLGLLIIPVINIIQRLIAQDRG